MLNVILTFLAVFGMGISTLYALSPTSRARGLVQPVFHNVQKHHIAIITDLVQRRPYCSISLRHDEAIDSLRSLRTKIREISGKCVVGASTVSTIEQVS